MHAARHCLFLQENYPATLNKDKSNQGLVDAWKKYTPMGNAYLAKYPYHMHNNKEIERNIPILPIIICNTLKGRTVMLLLLCGSESV